MEGFREGYFDGLHLGYRHREDPPFRDEKGVTDDELEVIAEEHGQEYARGFKDGYMTALNDYTVKCRLCDKTVYAHGIEWMCGPVPLCDDCSTTLHKKLPLCLWNACIRPLDTHDEDEEKILDLLRSLVK